MEGRLKEGETKAKQAEADSYRRGSEFEKMNALMEQKLQLTESELAEYKSKCAAKDADYKEANKELYSCRKEIQQLTNSLHRLEQDKNDEIKSLKAEHEVQVNELSRQVNSGPQGSA